MHLQRQRQPTTAVHSLLHLSGHCLVGRAPSKSRAANSCLARPSGSSSTSKTFWQCCCWRGAVQQQWCTGEDLHVVMTTRLAGWSLCVGAACPGGRVRPHRQQPPAPLKVPGELHQPCTRATRRPITNLQGRGRRQVPEAVHLAEVLHHMPHCSERSPFQ